MHTPQEPTDQSLQVCSLALVAVMSAEMTVSTNAPEESGKAGDLQITNAEFIEAVITNIPEGAFAATCSF